MSTCRPIYFPPCPTPVCPDVNPVNLSNGNLNGVGTMDSFSAQTGVFRGITGDGTYVSTTLDAGNHSIIVALIPAAIPAAIPQATETVSGKGEVATQAETNAGASDIAFVTPLKLGARMSTLTLAGLIEIATVVETDVLEDFQRAVTPYTLGTHLATRHFTARWSNAAARASVVPEFEGQLGVQLDTDIVYVSTGVAAGNWAQTYIQVNASNTVTANTTIDIDGGILFEFQTNGIPALLLEDQEVSVPTGNTFSVNSGATLSIGTTAVLAINNVPITTNNVLTTTTSGHPLARPISEFLSSYNTATWDAPTGTLARTTFDQSTVTLPELAKRVAALVTDLQAKLLPAI